MRTPTLRGARRRPRLNVMAVLVGSATLLLHASQFSGPGWRWSSLSRDDLRQRLDAALSGRRTASSHLAAVRHNL